jgi:hypothetical protein
MRRWANRGALDHAGHDAIAAPSITGTYELPVGRNRAFGSNMNRAMNRLAGGWNLSGILLRQSGIPLQVTQPGGNIWDGTQRPNLVGDPSTSGRVQDGLNRHVLAAAIKAKANLIVTINLKDFPVQTLAAWNLSAIHPDAFTTELLQADQAAVVAVVREMRARRKRPPINAEDFLLQLERQGLKYAVAALRGIGADI